MMLEETANVTCPYCGEPVDLALDVSAGSQSYIEDCTVCCQPMNVKVSVDADGGVAITVSRDDV